MAVVWSWTVGPSSPTTHTHQGWGSPDQVVLGFPQRLILTPSSPFFFSVPHASLLSCLPAKTGKAGCCQAGGERGPGRDGAVLNPTAVAASPEHSGEPCSSVPHGSSQWQGAGVCPGPSLVHGTKGESGTGCDSVLHHSEEEIDLGCASVSSLAKEEKRSENFKKSMLGAHVMWDARGPFS